jgi:hypothetical protein
MTTWSYKSALIAIALTTLAACNGGQGLNFAKGLGSVTAKPNAEALAQAPMAFGAITLVPPSGYCIDGETLKSRFALLARCDRLGADKSSGGPVGVITVSVTSARGAKSVPTPTETAQAATLTDVSLPRSNDNSVVFRAKGKTFSEQMSSTHWRGSALINKQLIGLALYGPPKSNAVSDEGRKLLAELIKRTQESSR